MQIQLIIERADGTKHKRDLSVSLSNIVKIKWDYQHGDQFNFNYVEPRQWCVPRTTILPGFVEFNFNLVQTSL